MNGEKNPFAPSPHNLHAPRMHPHQDRTASREHFDRDERLFERAIPLLKVRDHWARAGIMFEKYLRKVSRDKRMERSILENEGLFIEETLRHLPEDTHAVFTQLLKRYSRRLQTALTSEQTLLRSLSTSRRMEHERAEKSSVTRSSVEEEWQENMEEGLLSKNHLHGQLATTAKRKTLAWEPATGSLAESVFHARTGRKPKGAVLFRRMGTYFCLSCADQDDYQQASGLKKPSRGTYHSRMWVQTIKPDATELHLPKESLTIPVLLIRGIAQMDDAYLPIFRHELRHFVNDAFLGSRKLGVPLKSVEGMGMKTHAFLEQHGHDLRVEKSLLKIKDEVLAYLDAGDARIAEHLRRPLYAHLFKIFPPESRKIIEKVLRTIEQEVPFHALWNGNIKDGPSLLIAQLTNIPLLDIPRWLPLIDRYYETV